MVKILLALQLLVSAPASAEVSCTQLQRANIAWKEGRVHQADLLARRAKHFPNCRNAALSLLVRTRFAMARYDSAIRTFNRISHSYSGRSKLFRTVVDAFELMDQLTDARDFIHTESIKNKWLEKSLNLRITRPMTVSIRGPQELPVSSDSISKYLPGFQGSVSGPLGSWSGIVRVDTGGSFLAISPTLADRLGLEEAVCDKGQQGENEAEICFGVLNFNVGDISITNLPTIMISTLPETIGPIVGTRFLRLFNATLDYPDEKIYLAPKGEDIIFKNEPRSCRHVPFFLWGDHYMFAKGGLDRKRDLTFFIDSGSVFVDKNGTQAALSIRRDLLLKLGYELPPEQRGFVPAKEKTLLGEIKAQDLLIHYRETLPVESLGEVEIHGLLSHGFLKGFSWSIDFDQMNYRLCQSH